MAAAIREAERSLREITEAAEGVLRSQNRSAKERQRAFDALAEASSEPGGAFRGFTSAGGEEAAKPDWNEALAAARLELQSANILAAAGITAGETTPAPDTPAIDLRTAVDDAKTELAEPQARQAFFGKPARGAPSGTIEEALVNFRTAANRTIDSIVKDSEHAISAAITQIGRKGKDLLDAFDGITPLLSAGLQLAGFIKRAWDKLQSALQLLSQAFDGIASRDIREKVRAMKEALTLKHGIELAYQTDATRNIVKDLRLRDGLSDAEIDDRRDQMAQLARDFSQFTKGAIAISALASAVISVIAAHLTGPVAVLAFPATHALMAAVVLVTGIGVNDAWLPIQQVRGIRDIAHDLAIVETKTA